jgi:predicted transposase/invertase (TIGR01784 family)
LKTDSVFYRIFQASPGILFELLGQSPELAQGYSFESVEIKQVAFRLDGVLLPDSDAQDQTVWFVEFQMQDDPEFYHRFFAEIHLYLKLHPETLDWQAIIIFPDRSVEPKKQLLHRANLNSDQVHRVYLEDFSDISTESLGIGLMQLIVADAANAIAKAKELLTRTQPLSKTDAKLSAVVELIETIVVYKFPSLSREEIERMLGLSELRQTKVYQEALEEGREEGIAEGEQRGRTEGISMGRTEEARSLVLRQLTRRIGVVSPELQSHITILSLSQLEALGEALLDFTEAGDLVRWLLENGTASKAMDSRDA